MNAFERWDSLIYTSLLRSAIFTTRITIYYCIRVRRPCSWNHKRETTNYRPYTFSPFFFGLPILRPLRFPVLLRFCDRAEPLPDKLGLVMKK